jgi:hypothetical protein
MVLFCFCQVLSLEKKRSHFTLSRIFVIIFTILFKKLKHTVMQFFAFNLSQSNL